MSLHGPAHGKWLRRLCMLAVTLVLCYLLYFHSIAALLTAPGDKALAKFTDPIHGPEGATLWRADDANYTRASATILSLVRNEELQGMLQSMRELERTWNSKFNYPWTFINDVPFTDEFKTLTQRETKAECRYETVPSEHWDVPSWVNITRFDEGAEAMTRKGVKYASRMSYHQMCRWYSGFFYRHPALQDFQYYWRVEPDVNFYCDVDYDVFRYMSDHNKTYGFTINLYDFPDSLPSLWPETLKFLSLHPEYVSKNNALAWLADSSASPERNFIANGYSTCHFWSNFEIGDMNFWRAQPYQEYFDHLDAAGGFFYERWGDAPVHSLGVGLFEDVSKVHWFRDIGYHHHPYYNCPASSKCTGCSPSLFTYLPWLNPEDCRANWFKYFGTG